MCNSVKSDSNVDGSGGSDEIFGVFEKGVSFSGTYKNLVITVTLKDAVEVASICIAVAREPKCNINAFNVSFTFEDGKKSVPQGVQLQGNGNGQLCLRFEQIPCGQLVKMITITILGTNDGQLPKHVTLDIQVCTPPANTRTTTPRSSTTAITSASTTSAPVCVTCNETVLVSENMCHFIATGSDTDGSGGAGRILVSTGDGVSYDRSNLSPIVSIIFSTPIRLVSIKIPHGPGKRCNVRKFSVVFFFGNGTAINAQPIHTVDGPQDSAYLGPNQIPCNEFVSKVEITIVGTNDRQPPQRVVIEIQACVEPTTTRPPTTTRKPCVPCEKVQAVDEWTAKSIKISSRHSSRIKMQDFVIGSPMGASFDYRDVDVNITVCFDPPALLRSIVIPRKQPYKSNVQQFQVTFFDANGTQIRQEPVPSSVCGMDDDDNRPPRWDIRFIPCNTPVSCVLIEIIETTDDTAPRHVVLDIKKCAQPTTTPKPTTSMPRPSCGCCDPVCALNRETVESIVVQPKDLTALEKSKLVSTGVSFPGSGQRHTLIVVFHPPAVLQTISMSQSSNVKKFEVTFVAVSGKIILEEPVSSSHCGMDRNDPPPQWDNRHLPCNTLVASVNITIVETTDGKAPTNVVLAIKKCATTCLQTQAVDFAVSGQISVEDHVLTDIEKSNFQVSSGMGCSFPETMTKPTISVTFPKHVQLTCMCIPRSMVSQANVLEYSVTFYCDKGLKINDEPIVSKTEECGAAVSGLSTLLRGKWVSRLTIKILSTTGRKSPQHVMLDIKKCVEGTPMLTMSTTTGMTVRGT